MKIKHWVGSAALVTILGFTSIYGAPVQTVHVDLQSTTGMIPSALQQRMQASVQAATSYIYKGKEVEEIQAALPSYEKATMDIVDRILYGYTVKGVAVHVGETMNVNIQIEPYGHVMKSVETTIHYGNLSPYGKQLVEKDVGPISQRLEQILLGSSIDALHWVKPIAQKTVRNDLEGSLPEFTPQVDIVGGETGQVMVYLVPNGDSIHRTDVVLQSNTLPSAFFYTMRQYYEKKMRDLEGLPIQFVRRHQVMIEADIQKELNQSRSVTQFGITIIPHLEVGSDTKLYLQVDSSKYMIRGEGYLDMGRNTDSVGIRLYTGVHKGPHTWYLETEFLPNSLHWKFKPSYGYQFSKDTQVGYQYVSPHGRHKAFLRQDIGNRWSLRYERDLREKENEFAIAYDVHDYLQLEYIWKDKDRWLRLVGRV